MRYNPGKQMLTVVLKLWKRMLWSVVLNAGLRSSNRSKEIHPSSNVIKLLW